MSSPGADPDHLQTIGQVVKLLSSEFPDVTHSSLRFLEREGLIEPDRTSGGHRLFPPTQIERIRLIKQWQRQRLSLEEIKCRLASADRLPDPDMISRQILDLLIAGDRRAAQQLILQMDDAAVPLITIFDSVFRPALRETRARWARGDITAGQEKEISAFVRDHIAHLGSRHRPDERSGGPVVVAACVEGDRYELGLRMITALLRRKGYTVYYLGSDVSPEILLERVRARSPDAVLLAASRQELLPGVAATIADLRDAGDLSHRPVVIVGGAGVPEGWNPGDPVNAVVINEPNLGSVLTKIDQVVEARLRQA